MDQYAIIGFPLQHSFSPFIHNTAFKHLKIKAFYQKIEIDPDVFEKEIEKIKRGPIKGFNVTIPFKEKILPHIDVLEKEAQIIGAVNTIKKVGNQWYGFNTDWIGFLKPLKKVPVPIHHSLLLGAGGAARAVLFALLQLPEMQKITIVNRTRQKAEQLQHHFSRFSPIKIQAIGLSDLKGFKEKVDLLVNTTSVGMAGQQTGLLVHPEQLLNKKGMVYDLVYNPLQTTLLKEAQTCGFQILNGLPMLIFQAEAAFKIWTGQSFDKQLLEDLFTQLSQKI